MRRILVIDDSELIRQVAALALSRAGWETLTAPGGEEGLRAAAAERPDAVLLDIEMPGLDGPATLERLRAQAETAETPVLFLTAHEQAPPGADGVLRKPFEVGELAGAVAEALGWEA